MTRKILAVDINYAINLYTSGVPIKEIASKAEVGSSTIIRRMRDAGFQLRSIGESTALTLARRAGDLSKAVERYVSGETMQKVAADFGVTRRRLEIAVRSAGYTPRTMLQAVGLRYTNMSARERRSITAKANIAKRGRKASIASQERRARTLEVTLQLASRTDLLLSVWLAQKGIKFTPQKAFGPYNIDIAIEELAVAVEVNGSWHYFPDRSSTEIKRRNYLLNGGWKLIDVKLGKYLRPSCADKIISLLDAMRQNETSWGEHCVIGGDGELLS
jgi:very-short-patch-repair endonuclease/transposase